MVTEQYVSFEIAKLLKEKGFYKDVCITDWWYNGETKEMNKRGNYSYSGAPVYRKEYDYNAPSQSLAMRWLREVHHILISVNIFLPHKPTWIYSYYNLNRGYIRNAGGYNSYEEACEAALKYCLENLI